MRVAPHRRAIDLMKGRRDFPGPDEDGFIHGPARPGRKTKDLVKRLKPGDIAVIDHRNLDRIAAEDLTKAKVAAVVNGSPSSDGSYPNSGPLILTRAGIRLVDAHADDVFDRIRDGDPLSVGPDAVKVADGDEIAATELTVEQLEEALERQRGEIDTALRAFAENTVEHMAEEGELLSEGLTLPELETRFWDRHVLIVVRGPRYKRDLRALNAYIRDVKPILIGVDGGADALLESGLKPDMILGDMDSATDAVLSCGAELVVHAYSDGRAPGAERLQELGLAHHVLPAPGTSQDVAMLLSFEKGAALIVTVGAHFNLIEFLDKNREGMASTFLTRLRIGEVLVDAKGVSRLYRPGLGAGSLLLFMTAFILLAVIVVTTSSALDDLFRLIWLRIRVMLDLV